MTLFTVCGYYDDNAEPCGWHVEAVDRETAISAARTQAQEHTDEHVHVVAVYVGHLVQATED